jgi:hypothetical protein
MRWTDEMKLVLAKKTCINNAYIRSEGKDALTAEEKWKRVQSDICNDFVFKDYAIEIKSKSWESIRNQFVNFQKEVLKQFGADKEGVNLSGLEEMTEYQQLMHNMAEEIAIKKREAESKKKKAEKLQQDLLSNEALILKNSSSVLGPIKQESEVASEVTTSDISSQDMTSSQVGGGKKAKRSAPATTVFDNIETAIINLCDVKEEESLKRQKLELEARKVDLEERRFLEDQKRAEMEERRYLDQQKRETLLYKLIEKMMCDKAVDKIDSLKD